MKRFAFWFFAALVAVSLVRSNGRRDREPPRPRVVVIHDEGEHGRVTRTVVGSSSDEVDHELRRAADDARRSIREAARDVKEAAEDAREAAEEAARDAREAARQAARDARDAVRSVTVDTGIPTREYVEGLPVPVVPGSRVTVARPEPPAPPSPPKVKKHEIRIRVGHKAPQPPAKPKPAPKVEPITVVGRLSATETRAKDDARRALIETIREKLDGRVDTSWPIPESFLDGMTREVKVDSVVKDYGTMYEARLSVDAGPDRIDRIVEAYRHEGRLKRLALLGGGLLFVLVGLGAFSGYVRADEATKGYYTNRLRLVSALGLGAAGVAIYRFLS